MDGLHLNITAGTKTALAGETGSGKTSLLKMLSGLLTPDTGEVWFEGERIKRVPEEKLIPGHPGIGYLSQTFELPHFLSVGEVLHYANTLPEDEADALYRVCDIQHLLNRRTDQLSGGEMQRVAMARVLLGAPRLLLLDEPFSNLDLIHKQVLKNVIHNIGEKLKITCVLCSHDPLDTLTWADEIVVLRNGRIVQHAATQELYYRPIDEYTAGLFGRYNLLDKKLSALVCGKLGVPFPDRQLFLRPSQCKIVGDEEATFHGIVSKTFFSGGYTEVELMVSGPTLSVQVDNDSKVKAGDVLPVAVSKHELWYLPEQES